MSPISCCSPTGRIVIAGYLVVGIAADAGRREPPAIQLRHAELSWRDSTYKNRPTRKPARSSSR
jgi:hypothetical protein